MAQRSDLFAGANKPVAHIGRNGFDLSQSKVFSMRPAVIRPVFYQHTVPNSSFRFNASDLVRTASLQTAAFMTGKQELDFFFVPYSLIYTPANKVIMQRGDTISPGLQLDETSFPMVPFVKVVADACLPYLFYRFVSFYHAHMPSVPINQSVQEFCSWITLNRAIGQDFEAKMLQCCIYNSFDYNQAILFEELDFVGYDCLSILSTLGYGDFYVQLENLCSDAVRAAEADVQGVDYEVFNDTLLSEFQNFLGSLDLDSGYDFFEVTSGDDSRYVNLIELVSYQKIFNDRYRDSIVDSSFLYEVSSSLDFFRASGTALFSLNGASVGFIDDASNSLLTYLRPRRRAYKRDLSTGLYESTQFGQFAELSDSTLDYEDHNLPPEAGGNIDTSALAIRYTLALQRYKEMLMRAGDRTKDVLRAEFGVQSRYVDDHYVHYLGSFDADLNMNVVQATAETGSYSVGDLAGNVFSSLNGNTIEFTCNDYGIVIACLSFVAEPLHNAFGTDAFKTKHKWFDFYHEAFANLGLSSVSSRRFSQYRYDASGRIVSDPVSVGFGARDIEYKINLDTAHDSFCTFSMLPDQANGQDYSSPHDGAKSNYVVVRPTSQTVSLLKDRVYMLPSVMDTIFTELDAPDPVSYHFDVALNIECSAVLPMPKTGLNL